MTADLSSNTVYLFACQRYFWSTLKSVLEGGNINSCECFSGSRRDGQQRSVAIPTGDREDQELVLPQPDVGDEHWEKAGTQQQERGNLRTLHRD